VAGHGVLEELEDGGIGASGGGGDQREIEKGRAEDEMRRVE